jgi:methylmalonyl-CoA/ethylmalonyl-CoA epimerase
VISGIDHVAIAVRSLEDRLPFWADRLGLDVGGMETIEAEGVKIAFLEAGGSRIELLEPLDGTTSVARFLERRGEGLHHLTLRVDDLAQALLRLRERGILPLGGQARPGAGGSRVAFLHPRDTGGVLVELVQRAAGEAAPASREGGSFTPGAVVLLYLRDPQEKLWGVLRRLDGTGIVLHGMDLASFDDWVAQVERRESSVAGASMIFVPMARVERLLLDRSSGELLSLAERFRRRTGRSVAEVLDDEG